MSYTDLPYEGSQIVYTSTEVYTCIMLIYKCHGPSYAKGNLWIKVHVSAYFLSSLNWQSRI